MKVAAIFGTRPEAIKMAPVIKALKATDGINVEVVLTAQHRDLLDQALAVFDLHADRDLNVMRPRQSLAELNSRLTVAVDSWLDESMPDWMMVQGDTTSAFVAALAGFYRHVPVAHVEAGLRSGDATSPFPEEMNRRLVSQIASLHFAPTDRARAQLVAEGTEPSRVFVTGNPVVDALLAIRESAVFQQSRVPVTLCDGQPLILLTMHRRESWHRINDVCAAIRRVASTRPSLRVLFPVHPNPAVREPVYKALQGVSQVSLIEPMDYVTFIKSMTASRVVITDSGGVQEEAPVFGRPVLVLRDNTERSEAVEAGVARLVGTNTDAIVEALVQLLDDDEAWSRMSRSISPFGDGHAAGRIAAILAQVGGVSKQ